MEKKDKKQRDIVLSQDNALTTARYKFDLIEKRALYSIIRNIRAQYIENENGRRDLFDDLIITIHEEELKKCGDWADLNRKGTGTVCLMREFMNSCRGL